MGCSPSRLMRNKGKNITVRHRRGASESLIASKFQQNSQAIDDYYLLALSSRSDGVAPLDSQDQEHALDDPLKDADPVKEMYDKMKNLDTNGSMPPESWSEVSRVLSQFKFEAEQTSNKPASFQNERETIHIGELMDGLEEDIASPPMAACRVAEQPKSAEKRVFEVIHTIEELDNVAEPLPVASSCVSFAATPRSMSSTDIAYIEEDFIGATSRSPPFTTETAVYDQEALSDSSFAIKLAARSPQRESNPLFDALKASSISAPSEFANLCDNNPVSKSSSLKVDVAYQHGYVSPEHLSLIFPSHDGTRSENSVDEKGGCSVQVAYDVGNGAAFEEIDDTVFDPELLASLEEAFEKISENDWYSSRETADHTSHAVDNDPRRNSNASNSTFKGNKIQLTHTDACDSTSKTNEIQFIYSDASDSTSKSNKIQFIQADARDTTLKGNKIQIMQTDASDSTSKGNKTHIIQTDEGVRVQDILHVKQKKSTHFPLAGLQRQITASQVIDRFEVRCPPGGSHSVVLYLTSLRGIRKTFDDCNKLKTLILHFGIEIDERDVSLHSEFKQELKDLVAKTVPVPRLFIKGRYIGGLEDVLQLHEDGTLEDLLKGFPTQKAKEVCDGCGGVRFLPCPDCSGSCKVVTVKGEYRRCSDCNENGLVLCPICS
ncbi:hypothetical protein O6H91_02G008900 [Diphasiastrum complanatum]|uniref:Uncharacterized protein n=1 Tax=Diphasiastrum complanatum TaxID=34168 RepID=A0ACC2ECQ7_DIPCM|nr:hypothetical protein O6H91_02G008900 [Diphasiastrum complanatum]